jgi:hypothetical protein
VGDDAGRTGDDANRPSVTYREVWERLKRTQNISEIHQVLLLFSAALGGTLSRVPGFPALGRFFRNLFYYSVAYISPELKFDINRTIKEYNVLSILMIGFAAGLVVSFGFPAFFAWWSGTLLPDPSMLEPERVSFFEDRKNLQIYLLVSPAYLAISAAIIITAFRGWLLTLDSPAANTDLPILAVTGGERISTWRLANVIGMLLFVLFIPVWVNVNQFQSIMQVDHVEEGLYWFLDVSPRGDVRLNKAGVAYSIINSVKFIVILAAAVCYFASAAEMLRIASSVPHFHGAGDEILNPWRERLRHYALIELLTKGLVLVLAVHTSIFSKQPWQPQSNALLQALAIIVVGLGMVPFPRYYFEYRWLSEDRRSGTGERWPDLRPVDLRIFFVLMSTVLYVFAAAFGTVWSSAHRLIGTD